MKTFFPHLLATYLVLAIALNQQAKQCDANENKTTSNKVVVIGSGPAGMFFLHALAMKREKWEEAGDMESLLAMPDVTVFEKASSPGGVWRPASTESLPGSADMFGGLWSNSPSFDMEFFDFTHQDFFGGPVPLYLPRKHLLDYMLARVTRVEDIFQHVHFNTEVVFVEYNDDTEKFVVKTKDLMTGIETVEYFDKCIWAGGKESKPSYPRAMKRMLETNGFKGETMHSSEIVEFGESFKGKRILIVGDSYSAEDLALQALKVGANRVFITTADGQGVASVTSSWPGDRVDVLECLPSGVINNGTGLLCSESEYNEDHERYEPVEDGDLYELEDIAAVIYATGYDTQMNYLSRELRDDCAQEDTEWSAPVGWTANRNSLTRLVGNVKPSSKLYSEYVCDRMYRHALVSNPKMMFIRAMTQYYITEIDAIAWALAAYVSGEIEYPTVQEMEMRNYLERLDELNVPFIRKDIDEEYRTALNSAHARGLWEEDVEEDLVEGGIRHEFKLIARDQESGGHGGGLGSYERLSERGESLVTQYMDEFSCRSFPVVPEETSWRTFRDIDPSPYSSIFTGSKYVPLKGHWMDLDEDGYILS